MFRYMTVHGGREELDRWSKSVTVPPFIYLFMYFCFLHMTSSTCRLF